MLKPSELGLTSIPRNLSDYQKFLDRKINSLEDKTLVGVLKAIRNAKHGETINIEGLTKEQLEEINLYYSECVSPLLIQKHNMVGNLSANTWCILPPAQNQGMYDSILINGKKVFLVSNKQWKSIPNTLKIGDVVKLIENTPRLEKKWKNKKAFKVFKILEANKVITGPIKAVMQLYPDLINIPKKELQYLINQMSLHNDIIIKKPPKSLIGMLYMFPDVYKHFKLKGNKLTGTAINFIFERILIEVSKRDKSFNELFFDAVNVVRFFKFYLTENGKVLYKVEKIKLNGKPAQLRSKQGVERRSHHGFLKLDKLGFQIA
jgi:hypothetical protein